MSIKSTAGFASRRRTRHDFPFSEKQVREGVISYGLSSYGYDLRVSDEFKIFTNVNSAIIDPKASMSGLLSPSVRQRHRSAQLVRTGALRRVFQDSPRRSHHLRGQIDLCPMRHHRQCHPLRAGVGRLCHPRNLEHDSACPPGSMPTKGLPDPLLPVRRALRDQLRGPQRQVPESTRYRSAEAVMADPAKSPSRLRVALLEPSPSAWRALSPSFRIIPCIEFVVFELPEFLADQEIKVALIGLHGEKLPLPLVGTIHGLRPDVRLVVMGPTGDDEMILQAVTAGAKAYLEASATPQQVEQAIMTVSQGSIWAPRRVLSIFVDRATKSSRVTTPALAQFTARETEVLKLLVAARSNREIARTLGIEERTVKRTWPKLDAQSGRGEPDRPFDLCSYKLDCRPER